MFIPIDLSTFSERTGIGGELLVSAWADARQVVSLRDLRTIVDLRPMPRVYVEKLIRNIGLDGDPATKPYLGCEIRQERIEPSALMIGQTFVERAKYRAILEEFDGVFADFSVPRGISKLTAHIALGRTADGAMAMAHYLPPIIEEHGGRRLLLDGIHRNYVVKNAGTTIECIVIGNVAMPFPCDPQDWGSIKPVDAKPPKEQRYFNLRPELFRDVKRIGIDG